MDFTDLRILRTREKLQNALLELLRTREMKTVTVREICGKAGISRNAFYQHYRCKEDLYDEMVATATEEIRASLLPVVPGSDRFRPEVMNVYAGQIMDGVSKVKPLVSVMLKGDNGVFLRQLTDLIFGQNLANALPFFDVEDSGEIRLFYEFVSAGEAAFIIRWIRDGSMPKEQAAALLSDILLQSCSTLPGREIR